MTNEEIRKIYELKNQGYGYKKIANELNLSVSTIKSYLLRHKDEPAISYCLYCGRKLVHMPKKKKKKYIAQVNVRENIIKLILNVYLQIKEKV